MNLEIKLPPEFEELIISLVKKELIANGYERVNPNIIHPLSVDQIRNEGSDGIIHRVCAVSCLKFEEIIEKTRKREIIEVRQLLHFILKKKTNYSLAAIGMMVGCKDHATVINSVNTIQNLLDTSDEFCERYSELIYLYELK